MDEVNRSLNLYSPVSLVVVIVLDASMIIEKDLMTLKGKG